MCTSPLQAPSPPGDGTRYSLLALALASCAAGCHVGSPGAASPRLAGHPVRIDRAWLRAGADRSDRALLLGTAAGNTGTWLPLAGAARIVSLDARWADTRPGAPARLVLATTPMRAPAPFLRLGASASRPLRSAAWTAALAATAAVDKDVTYYRLSAHGVSAVTGDATALLAVGFLAGITGARIDPRATVIGNLLIDGTIGPVPDLAQRVRAAAAAGATRIGVPRGEDLARATTARTVAIGDLDAAYALVTSARLPATIPAPPAEMALGPRLTAAVRAAYRRRRRALAADWPGVAALAAAGPLPAPVRALARRAQAHAFDAERAFRRGAVATAWARLGTAATAARAVLAVRRVVAAVRAGDPEAAVQPLSAIAQLRAQLDAKFVAIAKRISPPSSVEGQLSALFAFQWAIRAEAMLGADSTAAERRIRAAAALPKARRRLRATLLAVAGAALPPLLAAERARASLSLLEDTLALAPVRAGGVVPGARAGDLYLLGRGYRAAARARLAAAERGSRTQGENPATGDDAPTRLVPHAVAYAALRRRALVDGVPTALRARWGKRSAAWRLATLAGAAVAYYETARLIDVRAAVGLARDAATGLATRVEKPAALARLLASAERKARQHAHAAQVAVGRIPTESRLAYQVARGLAGGDVDDRVTALELYWLSSLSCELTVEIARNAAPPTPRAALR